MHASATLLFLGLSAVGWHLLPNGIWGLYTLTDGALAAWNSASIFLWSEPLDASPQNFMQGLGSLYIPNTPWLNPGALALSLPLEPHLQYYSSYAVYLLEVFVSVVVLGRVVGFSTLRSVLAGQFLCLIIFPPYTSYFFTLPWISLAPFNAHLMAICNLLLALFTILGTVSTRQNIAAALGIAGLLVCAFYSAAVTWATYVPVYLLFAFVIATYQPTRRSLLWKSGLVAMIAIAALLLGVPEFYIGTAQVTSSHMLTQSPAFKGFVVSMADLWDAWKSFDWCTDHPQTFVCSTYAIAHVHVAGLLGALILSAFYRGIARRLGLCMLAYILFLHLYAIAAQAQLLSIFNRISKDYLLFSSYTFYALFSIAALFSLLDGMKKLFQHPTLRSVRERCTHQLARRSVTKKTPLRVPALLYASGYVVIASLAPVAAILILIEIAEAPFKQILVTRQLPPPVVHIPQKTSVTDTLAREIGLYPGATFRGLVATYFGAPTGPLREKIGFKDQPYSSTSLYNNGRFYMQAWYGNSFMMTDLWRFNIPSFEEYGQWITKPLYVFTKELLSFSKLQDNLASWEINIYQLNLPLMQALGIRFIITDSELSDDRLMLRTTHKASAPVRPEIAYFAEMKEAILKGEPVAVHLYEIKNPNLGSYSPVKVIPLKTVKEILDRLRDTAFSPETEAVLQEDGGSGNLVRATESRMDIEKGRIRVVARSEGKSILLLPVQFSRCLRVTSRIPGASVAKPRLFRANLVETALLFDHQADINISFDFGPGRSWCRVADAADYKKLDFSPWGR